MTVWELPGPGSFVRRVADAFRDGRNVIVRFPRHSPDGFWLALRGEYERDPILEVTRLHCDGHEGSPFELLFREFGSNASINALHDMATLTTTSLFSGRLVSIEGLRSEQWPAWRTFLADYEQVCRNIDQLQRTLFLAQMNSEWGPAP